jgi:hypothetical protein
MAKARCMRIIAAEPGTQTGRITETHEVVYVGADVPGGFDTDHVRIENLDYSIQPAQIQSAIAAAIRARAASIGISVGNSEVLLDAIVKG